MGFKHLDLARGIMADAGRLLFGVSGACLASMVVHEPGSNAFTLVWAPEKTVPYISAWIALASIVSLFRYRAWRRAWDEKVALALGADA